MGAISIATHGIISKDRHYMITVGEIQINIDVRSIDINIEVQNDIDINIMKE